MIMKTCLLAVLFFVATYAKPPHPHGGPPGQTKNNPADMMFDGGMCPPMLAENDNIDEYEALLKPHLDDNEELSNCDEVKIEDVKARGKEVMVRLGCSEGIKKFAYFTVERYEIDEIVEKPEPAKKGMTGGWSEVDELNKGVEKYMRYQVGSCCEIDRSQCMVQVVNGKNYYCPAKCFNGDKHVKVYETLQPTVTLKVLSDRPQLPMPPMRPDPRMKNILNNGVTMENVDDFEELFRPLLDSSDELKDCSGATIEKVYSQGWRSVAQVNCNGDTKYAQFIVNRFELLDKDDKPMMPKGPMAGGYQSVYELDSKLEGFMTNKMDDNCQLIKCGCMSQQVNGVNHYCPARCGKETKNIHVYQTLSPTAELESVSDVPQIEDIKRMTNEHLSDIVQTSSDNTFIFLKDQLNFEGDNEDFVVEQGSYVDLKAGIQYCISVTDGDKQNTLAIYKFAQPKTTPFMVAHPFDEPESCDMFIMKIASMWLIGQDHKM